ncbi:MAG: hypothetical protein LBU41_01930, partial [Clostridiales Family XIII bacterium]|nr:hypothetical protein [Clostridiales Family XIII bacterium]
MLKIVSSGDIGTMKRHSVKRILAITLVFVMLAAVISPGLSGGKVYAADTTTIDVSTYPDYSGWWNPALTNAIQAALDDPDVDTIILNVGTLNTLYLVGNALSVPLGKDVSIKATAPVTIINEIDEYHFVVDGTAQGAVDTRIAFENITLDGENGRDYTVPSSPVKADYDWGGGIYFDTDSTAQTLTLYGAIVKHCTGPGWIWGGVYSTGNLILDNCEIA